MNGLDIVIVVLLLGGAFYGYRRGAIRQLASALGVVLGIGIAFAASGKIGPWLERSTSVTGAPSAAISYVIVALLVIAAIKLLASLTERIICRSRVMRLLNSVAGAGFAIASTAAVLAIVAASVEWAPVAVWAKGPIQQSLLASTLRETLQYPALTRTRPDN